MLILLITFANSLNPDQAGQIVGSNLDPICLRRYSFEEFFEKFKFEKKNADNKKTGKISQGAKSLERFIGITSQKENGKLNMFSLTNLGKCLYFFFRSFILVSVNFDHYTREG